jgi:hypothetical protein
MARIVGLAALLTTACAVDRAGLALSRDGSISVDAPTTDAWDDLDAQHDAREDDQCPDDPNKTAPGACGCGVPDTDADSDDVPDCVDGCRTDPAKTEPGNCGCGVADVDADADGQFACDDCDDANETVSPEARDVCNSRDDDCDDAVDEEGACDTGCSDGEREALPRLDAHPDVAACAGAWRTPGLATERLGCAAAGDDSTNTAGTGCAAADLCSSGWHVCGSDEVTGCADPSFSEPPAALFVVLPRAPCSSSSLVGCGNVGPSAPSQCSPLTRRVESPCESVGWPWRCSDPAALASTVEKLASPYGGVLCCRDR